MNLSMNQTLLGIARGLGYPVLFAALTALIAAIPDVANFLPVWLPAGVITMALAAGEHQLAIEFGYNLPNTTSGVSS
jgi:hypothetical protein